MKGWTEDKIRQLQAKNQRLYRFWIGIDTGTTTGLAVYDRLDCRLVCVTSGTITQMMKKIRYWTELKGSDLGVFVRFEDARLRKYIPAMPNESRERGRREGAGSVKRDAKIWEDFLLEEGIPFEAVAPKDNVTKINAAKFKGMTGWKEQTNEHERDATFLVYGL